MVVFQDIKKLTLARLMGVISFGVVVYMLLFQRPIDYVNAAVYVMLIVWGATFGKNLIDRGVKR